MIAPKVSTCEIDPQVRNEMCTNESAKGGIMWNRLTGTVLLKGNVINELINFALSCSKSHTT